jgi:hypothetical protein
MKSQILVVDTMECAAQFIYVEFMCIVQSFQNFVIQI